MKLTLLVILVCTLQVSASVYSQTKKFDLTLKNVSVKEVFKAIESQSDFRFFYNDELSDVNRLVTIDLENMKVEDVLSSLFDKSRITYKVLDNNLIVITPSGLIYQKQTVTGTVIDANTNEPLPGVNITVEGTTLGTVSDGAGKYSIELPSTNSVLVFSFVGYISERSEVSGKSIVDIKLVPDIRNLEEVVVIGYGSRAKKDVTTAISTVSSENIEKNVGTSAEYAMMGRMTGVHVSAASGDPLSRPTVRIRGQNTWGIADPLYVIDGIPITEGGAGAESITDARFNTLRGTINIMTLIDPNDIESMSVLKDASAAAIYGVRAANGVILITTKRGKGDKPQIEFSSRYGIQNIPKTYDVMGAAELIKFKQEAYLANTDYATDQSKWAPELNPSSPKYKGNFPTTDWQTPGINKNAASQEYSLRLSGGTGSTNYYLSSGYANTEGVLIGKDINRYTVSANVTSNVNKWMRLGMNYRLAYINGDNNDKIDKLSTLKDNPSWMPVYDENGYLGYASSITENADHLTGSTGRFSADPKPNYYGQQATTDKEYGELRNLGNVFAEIEPLKGLKIKGSISGDWYKRSNSTFIDYDGWVFSSQETQSGKKIYGLTSVGALQLNDAENLNLIKELSVNYTKEFGDHNIDLLFNASDEQYSFLSKQMSGSGMTSKSTSLRYIANMQDKFTNVQTDKIQNALQGYMGRLSYRFKSKYYLDATLRYDGSSKFAPKNRWGTFPSFSAAWRISSESFLSDIQWLNDLKIRAGWGKLGNHEVRDMAWISGLINQNPAYSWGVDSGAPGFGIYGSGAAILDLGNSDLTWEKTTTSNIGFDAVLLRSLVISAEYYYKKTDGIIQQVQLPVSPGIKNPPFANVAQVSNKGIEISVSYENTIGDLRYSVGGNITTVENTVLKTYEGKEFDLADNKGHIAEGKPIGYVQGLLFGGVFQSSEEAAGYKVKDDAHKQTLKPGDVWYKDIHGAPDPANGYPYWTPGGDSIINDYDRTMLYSSIPGYYYGLNISLDWKGIDFSSFFQGVGDAWGNYNPATGMGSSSNGTLTGARDSWTAENHSSWIPRNVYGDPNGNFRTSDRDKKSKAYLRLQTLQLGYSLPKSIKGDFMSNLRVYISLTNLMTITNWPGLNPDGADETPRVFSVGLNAKF